MPIEVSKGAKIRNRYNQVPHLTQDTDGKVTNSQLETTNESQEVSPFPDILLTVPRRYFFCESLWGFFCLVFVMPLCASVYVCPEVTCWERTDLLTLVCSE